MVHYRTIPKEHGVTRALKAFQSTKRERPFLADNATDFCTGFAPFLESMGASLMEEPTEASDGTVRFRFVWSLRSNDQIVHTGFKGALADYEPARVLAEMADLPPAAIGEILYRYGGEIINDTRPGPTGVPGCSVWMGLMLLAGFTWAL